MTSLVRPPDEFANLLTHGCGVLLGVVGVGHLLASVADHPPLVFRACAIYSATLLLVYASSTLSHLFYDIAWRRHFRMWDQASIFLLIAGTYTPFALMYLHRDGWPWLTVAMWGFGMLGVWRVVRVADLSRLDKLAYVIQGFLPVIALKEVAHKAPAGVVIWIVLGGVTYLLGLPFLASSASRRYAHATWHVFAMIGSACHYWAILLCVTSPSSQ